MNHNRNIARHSSPYPTAKKLVWGFVFLAGVWLSACTTLPASLRPQSSAAEQIAGLSWVIFALGTLIWVGVVVLLLMGLFRRRNPSTQDSLPVQETEEIAKGTVNRWVVGGGIVMPTVVLVGLVALTVGTLRYISDIIPSDEVVIEVVGHQWWWEIRYPEQGVITANELHIPVGQPIEIQLSSVDVIHSIWVPELHGKFDLIPGKTLTFVLEASEPGLYRGQCAEFCGRQHAKMGIHVVAQSAEDFAQWIESQVTSSVEPTSELALEGQQVFLTSDCVECHTIRGTPADGTDGPDLTHLMSRQTLAAISIPNTPQHLADWIENPQTIKPGNLMPEPELDPSAIEALLAYLEGLK